MTQRVERTGTKTQATGRRSLVAGMAALAAGAAVAATDRPAHALDGDAVTLGARVRTTNPTRNPTWIEAKVQSAPAFRVTNGAIIFQGRIDDVSDAIQGVGLDPGTSGVFGRNDSDLGTGVSGVSAGAQGVGVRASGGPQGIGVRALALGTNGQGVVSDATVVAVRGNSANGIGVHGASTGGFGVFGGSGGAFGVFGLSTATAGVFGQSGNSVGVFGDATKAPGVLGQSPIIGVLGKTATGHALRGEASGAGIGVYGISGSGGFAGYFDGNVFVAGTITQAGAATTAVALADGSLRRVYGHETTEPLIEDIGEATLTNGRVEVRLDADFAAIVRGDRYHAFLTEEGDLGGLYVARKGPAGFEVLARMAGASGTFAYRVVARRKDAQGARLEKLDRAVLERAKQVASAVVAAPAVPKPPTLPEIVPDARDADRGVPAGRPAGR